MARVLLLGATGLLGSAIYGVLKDECALTLTVRSRNKIPLLEKAYGGTERHRFIEFDAGEIRRDAGYYEKFLSDAGEVDYVINAIGITKPFAEINTELTYFINGDFPNMLARTFGPALIHIATDGVFDGKNGPYNERSPLSPVGTYAISKSRGEPKNALVLRTSVIGRELENFTGLIEWFLQQNGKTISGFAQQYWNGITAKEFGEVCERIISERTKYPESGLYHIFSNTLSKYDMLRAFRDKWDVDCTIEKDGSNPSNRTLSTVYDLNAKLAIPTFEQMLATL